MIDGALEEEEESRRNERGQQSGVSGAEHVAAKRRKLREDIEKAAGSQLRDD